MNNRDWKVLLSSLASQGCVAFVGPGFSVTGPEGEDQYLPHLLSHHLAQILQEEKQIHVRDPENLALVAECFVDNLSREDLEVEVKDFYSQRVQDLPEDAGGDTPFENLARLPLPLIVSARHDQMLQHFLRAQGKVPTEKSYDFRGDTLRTIGQLGTVDRPLVYHLLGSIEEPTSLAITERDLLDCMESVISGSPALPADLRNQFHEKSFLFLGCGIHRHRIRVLLHALGFDEAGKKSFALDPVPPNEDEQEFREKYQDGVVYYQLGYKELKLLEFDEGDFVGELRRRWEEMYPPGADQRAPVARVSQDETEDRPTVFVSYVKEDGDFAEGLVESLKYNGIEPWIDKEKLRFGDQWKYALDDAIKKTHFFVVLLSDKFRDGVDTYVHIEVEKALERKGMRGAVKFIYPLMISDNVKLLDALDREHIQAQRFEGDDRAVADLALDIKKQFEIFRVRGA